MDLSHSVLPKAFEALGLEASILTALAEIHFVEPSEIQRLVIPPALSGVDILGQARTGTGKTAAFGLHILQRLDPAYGFQALIVVPTRELAVQVHAEMVRFAKHKALRIAVVYGGTKVHHDLKSLERQPHIIVGTPGRIIDLNERGVLPMGQMKFVVCDEVDRMFDIGFRDDVRKILAFCTSEHQTMFVSATINDEIERLVERHMKKNVARIFTAKPDDKLTTPDARQFVVGVQPWDKLRALRALIADEKPKLAIIFCRTKRNVDKVAHALEERGINASPIHGDLVQQKRERVMRGFRTGKINVLVATDLASRGIDVHEITHVVNYDVPEDPEAYVHRVGRTARMGATGRAFTFVARDQGQLQTEIEKLTNHLMEEYRIPGFNPSPEPGNGPHRTAGSPTGSGWQAPAATVGVEPELVPAEQPQSTVSEYSPTGFSIPANTQSTRPISGKFPTRRRR